MTIFISRNLAEDSIFKQILDSQANLIGCSLVAFKALSFGDLPKADWLFFYSKNGIKYCLEQIENFKDLPSIAVIGQASADYLKTHYKLEAQFIGTGEPASTSADFLVVAKGKKVIFARAKESKQSIQKKLENQVQTIDLVVYDNAAKTAFDLPKIDILVFTSPLNVAAYFSKYSFEEGQKIVCIGQTTAHALRQLGLNNMSIATAPNEMALAQACLDLIHPSN